MINLKSNPLFSGDRQKYIFIARDLRLAALGYLAVLLIVLNTLVSLAFFENLKDLSFVYQNIVFCLVALICFFQRNRRLELSSWVLHLALAAGFTFYLLYTDFNRIATLSVAPVMCFWIFFFMGRWPGILFGSYFASLGLLGLYQYGIGSFSLPVAETSIHFVILGAALGIAYFVKLQLRVFEERFYDFSEKQRLAQLTSKHKESVYEILNSIGEDLDQQFFIDLKQRDEKSSQVFERSYKRLIHVFEQIHRLHEMNLSGATDKVYDIWQSKKF